MIGNLKTVCRDRYLAFDKDKYLVLNFGSIRQAETVVQQNYRC
jgi:hypothetical protein